MGRIVEAIIETPRFGLIKRKADGGIDFISPVPCPFNYGRVADDLVSGDGDPLDAIVLGPRLAFGARTSGEHRMTVHFVDDGQEDPKLILSIKPIAAFELVQLKAFFLAYVPLKRALNAARGRFGSTRVSRYELID